MTPHEEEATASLLAMEHDILESKKNYNLIPSLLLQMQEMSGTSEGMRVAVSLCRVFSRLFAQGSLTPNKSLSEKDTVVVHWLKEQYSTFKRILRSYSTGSTSTTLSASLETRMLAMRAEARHSNALRPFQDDLRDLILDLLSADSSEYIGEFAAEFILKYEDVRFYTFKHIK